MKRKRSLRMADGGVLLAEARPVSPLSLRGIGRGLASIYDDAVGATSNAIETAAKTIDRRPPPGYTPALATAPAPAAAPGTTPGSDSLQLGGMNLGVIQRREAAAGLRDGTAFLEGPGGPTDDKIDAKLSRGEAVLPADTVQKIGPKNVQALIDTTHTPVKSRGLRHFANGIDVLETPFTDADARLFNTRPAGTIAAPQPQVPGMRVDFGGIQDPGPGNPNVNRMGPPRPTMPAAPPVTPAAPTPTAVAEPAALPAKAGGLRNFVTGGSGDVGQAFKSVGGGVARGVGATLRAGAAIAPFQAAITGLDTDTEQYAKRFGLENTEPGVMRDLGIRALGVASDVGDAMTFGQASRLFRDKQGATDAMPRQVSAPAAAPATAPVQPTAATAPASLRTAPALDNSVLPGGAQVAKIQRRGNSFTNTGEFIEDQRAGAAPSAANVAAVDRIAARSTQGLRGGLDETNLPAGFGTTVPGVNAPASQAEAELEARNASVRSTVGDRDLSPRTRLAREQMERADSRERAIASARDATERRGQDITNEGFARRDKVTLRGQDLDFASKTRGQDMTARTAAATARVQQMNTDRQFNFDREKHGDEVAQQRFQRRQAAEKSVHEQVTNMIPPGPDGKPDTATAARYTAGLNALVAQQQGVLQQRAAQGDKQAQAALDDLSENGLSALDQRTVRNFIQGMKVNDLRAQNASGPLNPIGGTDVITDVPAAGLRKTSNGLFGFGGEFTVIGADGKPQGTIPARAVEGDGSFIFPKRRTDLRDFIR